MRQNSISRLMLRRWFPAGLKSYAPVHRENMASSLVYLKQAQDL